MSTFMFKYLNHDLRLLKFNKPLHFFAEMPLNESWFGGKKIAIGIFLSNNLFRFGYRKQTFF